MRIPLLLLSAVAALIASPITTSLVEIENDRAAVIDTNLREGMSGVIIRNFDNTHHTIIANARVDQVNPSNGRALLRLSPYDGLVQESLPSGKWSPKASDTALIAYDYDRAMLIAPNDETYDTVTDSMKDREWVHPDNFAAYLSVEGHPTPLTKDFHQYCTANSIGLLYVQSAQTLFTLDCKSFKLLQLAPSAGTTTKPQTPFYTRVPSIRAGWWGEGSGRLSEYDPYYLEQIALNNPKNKELYALFKAKFGEKSALLRYFELKE